MSNNIFESFFYGNSPENEYGGERVRVKMSNGEFKLGTIHDRMAGRHGYIGILFRDGTHEFVEEFDVNVIESELLELEILAEICLTIQIKLIRGEAISVTIHDAYEARKHAFKLAKQTGWTPMHSVIIPELTRMIKGV